MSACVIVCAFDPIEELGGECGVVALPTSVAQRLVDEHRAELIEPHMGESMRYVVGSEAYEAARQALRDARGLVEPPAPAPAPKARKAGRLLGD